MATVKDYFANLVEFSQIIYFILKVLRNTSDPLKKLTGTDDS